jgi:hypothetical protein
MQNDILPPVDWRKTKKSSRKNLNGLKFDVARGRFIHGDVHTEEHAKAIAMAKVSPKGRFHHWSRRRKILISLTSVVLISGAAAGAFLIFFHQKPAPVIVQQPRVKAAPPPPKTVASPLTGLQIDPALATRPVTAVMIENSPDARPQSGLQDAGVVFEAIAEAGITRFMGLFQEAQPQYVGPVRSLRPYYIDFAAPFQASIAHVGGSPDALAQVRSGSYRDIDQFFNGGFYWRIGGRYAPHNVYTSFAKLDALNQGKGYKASQFAPWKRKVEKPLATPTAAHINVHLSGPLYDSHYDYDAKTNTYLRSEAGSPHLEIVDAARKQVVQLHPKVVVAIVMSYSVIDRAGHSSYGITGRGQAIIFQDGGVQVGKWDKPTRNSMFNFVDDNDAPIPLDAGQTWVVGVTPGGVHSTP